MQEKLKSMGKKGQSGTHFNGKYIGKKSILYLNRKLQVKLEVGVSGFMDILLKYKLCKTFVSL